MDSADRSARLLASTDTFGLSVLGDVTSATSLRGACRGEPSASIAVPDVVMVMVVGLISCRDDRAGASYSLIPGAQEHATNDKNSNKNYN